MKEKKAKVLLHPIRLKIVQEFLGGRTFTTKELVSRLPSIPQATLYRHLDKLVKSNILDIVEKNQIRGTVEKVYGLNLKGANVSQEDIGDDTREEHMKYFMVFVSLLLQNYEKYLSQDDIDLERDGVAYRQAALYLSDEEFQQFVKDIGAVFQEAIANEPSPERKKRIISTIIMPEVNEEE